MPGHINSCMHTEFSTLNESARTLINMWNQHLYYHLSNQGHNFIVHIPQRLVDKCLNHFCTDQQIHEKSIHKVSDFHWIMFQRKFESGKATQITDWVLDTENPMLWSAKIPENYCRFIRSWGANLVFESKHSVEEEREDILPFMKTCPCRYILPELHTPQPGGKRYISKALRNPTGGHLELFFNMIHKNKLQD